MYRLSSSNLIRKGLARVHLFVLSLRYRYTLLALHSPARRDKGWIVNAFFSFQFRNPHSEFCIRIRQLFLDDTKPDYCKVYYLALKPNLDFYPSFLSLILPFF